MEKLSLQEALHILLAYTGEIAGTEEVGLLDGAGRVLAENVAALHHQPPFDRSPLDGYAVCSEDLKGASGEHPARLRVIDEVCAGHVSSKKAEPGKAVRIMTGAPIPEGADCIVRQENTDYGMDEVLIYHEGKHGENYCFAGEDYRAGEELLKKGTLLGAAQIGLLASLGRERVSVYRRLRAAVFSTGDELMEPGRALLPGKIYDSNLYATTAQLLSYGADVRYRECAPDEKEVVAKRIETIAEDVDLILTTGGVSVGKMDIMHDVLKLLQVKPLFWKVALKPGMPTLTAVYRKTLLICLSGNPYGAFVNTELLVRPVIAKMSRRPDLVPKREKAVLLTSYEKPGRVTRYVRAYYEDHQVRVADGSNSSGILSTLSGCNCLLEIPAGTGRLKKGEEAEVVLL